MNQMILDALKCIAEDEDHEQRAWEMFETEYGVELPRFDRDAYPDLIERWLAEEQWRNAVRRELAMLAANHKAKRYGPLTVAELKKANALGVRYERSHSAP